SKAVSSMKKEIQKTPATEEGDPSGQPRVIFKLFIHTVAMFTLPFIAYYKTRNYVHMDLEMTFLQGYIYGAVAAVIVVNLIIASYVYQALAED
ncbi:Vacuolar ATPase assembly integral membrane protein Vma21, partial [Trinorchestia longiramus]